MIGELLYEFSLEIVVLVGIFVIRFAFTYLGKRFEIVEQKELARAAVRFTEQVFHDLDGPAKFKVAKERLAELAEERGIFVSDEAARLFIEEAVHEMKEVFVAELDEIISEK